jgi:hypothetical protein
MPAVRVLLTPLRKALAHRFLFPDRNRVAFCLSSTVLLVDCETTSNSCTPADGQQAFHAGLPKLVNSPPLPADYRGFGGSSKPVARRLAAV